MSNAQLLSLIIFLPALSTLVIALLPKNRDDIIRGFTLLVTIITMGIVLRMAWPGENTWSFDISQSGMELISDIKQIYENYGYETQILVASIRHPDHVVQSLMIGADVATMPYKIFQQIVKHPLTDSGLARFLKDWENAKK